jgi:hypothetical protein
MSIMMTLEESRNHSIYRLCLSKMQASGLIYREKVPASSTFLIRLIQPYGKAESSGHIDSYLTEIYLLYLIRGVSS